MTREIEVSGWVTVESTTSTNHTVRIEGDVTRDTVVALQDATADDLVEFFDGYEFSPEDMGRIAEAAGAKSMIEHMHESTVDDIFNAFMECADSFSDEQIATLAVRITELIDA